MTKDDMIQIAHKAGWDYANDSSGFDPLWKFGELVAAAEREACASLCKGLAAWHSETVTAAYENAAYAIRARGQE